MLEIASDDNKKALFALWFVKSAGEIFTMLDFSLCVFLFYCWAWKKNEK